MYKDPRPAERFTRFHERARRQGPDWVFSLVRVLIAPLMLLLFRLRSIDSDNLPPSGPAIVAPNHFSFLDHFFVAFYQRRRVQFVAKSQLFRWPMRFVYSHGGAFPVRRGQRDEEAFATAHAVLRRGGVVVMYAEGGRSRSEELGEPRPGVGRLALESGAPVLPTAIAGSARVREWRHGRFPKVTVQFGSPVRFARVEHPTREQAQVASEQIFARTRQLYESLQQGGRRDAVLAARAARHTGETARRHPLPE